MTIAVVQHAQNITVFSSGTSGTATAAFASNITPGNCVVAVISGSNGSGISFGAPGSVTTHGSADHWAFGVQDPDQNIFVYYDPGSAGGQTVIDVNVTWTGTASATTQIAYAVDIYEISGVMTVSPVDVTQGNANFSTQGTAWTSAATATTSNPNEIFIGGAFNDQNALGGTSYTITGPSSPWVNAAPQKMTVQYNGSGAGNSLATYQVAGYDIVSSLTAGTYSGTSSVSCYFSAAILSLKAPLAGPVVNQWAATFAQPASIGPMPPALQSTVIALDSGTSVGGGTGTPTAGNWLVAIAGMNEQSAASGFTVGDSDDIHSYWRPAKVSTASGLTRTSVWYTANTARQVNFSYIAPNGAMDGLAVLILEISGLGPWDVLTVTDAAYAAAATALNLAAGAPSAASFMLAAVAGDNSSAGQAFSPAGWTGLHTVTATNGTNHVSDVVLTSAYLASNSSSVSVNGTASTAEDLSGVLIGIELSAPSPIPSVSGVAPGWPGRTILEFAPGAGFETPQDELTWVTLNDSAVAPGPGVTKRYMGWADQGGIPYALAQLQSSTGTAMLDNADGHLTPSNSASPWYPDVTTGTPVRLRVALGTLTGPLGSTVVNRWYVIQRNMLDAQEKRDSNMRGFVDMSLTDIWSVASASCPSPYRGEVLQDTPYAWWTCDDQAGVAQVLPTALRNSAPGNTSVLNIELSPNGLVPQHPYNNYGYNLDVSGSGTASPTATASYAVAASSGWMYGDPQSSPSSSAAGNPVTASPGAAAWQSSGVLGNTGSYNWFLACNDASFPVLSGGITVEGWFQYQPYFSGTRVLGYTESTFDTPVALQQPYAPTTLFEIATGSAPVAILQFAIGGTGVNPAPGALNLITYNGGTPASHTIYSGSELRNGSWFHVAATFTPTAWRVLVNGGQTADVSGTATGMTSAWTWFLANGDLGSSGGSTLSAIQHGGNAQFSGLTIYPSVLPAYRIMAHYLAAATGFGLIPTPAGVTVAFSGALPPGQTLIEPDGSMTTSQAFATLTAYGIVTANIGSYSSGPSAWAVNIQQNIVAPSTNRDILEVSWTAEVAPAFSIYTGSSFGTETEAASVCGTADYFTSGFGSGATGFGNSQVASGTGASPPSTASALGDTVSERIERCLGYGGVTYPGRSRRHDAEPGGGGARRGRPAVRRERQQPRPER